jgi:type II secretory pathway predicted ATPase ExeA
LQRLLHSKDFLILIIGESGSGKTTLLNRFLASADVNWRTCRIRAHFLVNSNNKPRIKNLNDRRVYILPQDPIPIVMFDDAHDLTGTELKYLLQDALVPGSSQKLKRLVLFGEPSFMATLEHLSAIIAEETILNKIYMPPLTISETAIYLRHRLSAAGYTGKNPFKPSVINVIQKASGGLPGRINAEAHTHLAGKGSRQMALLNILRKDVLNRIQKKVWVGAAATTLLLAIIVLIFNHISPIFRTEHQFRSGSHPQMLKKFAKKASLPSPVHQVSKKTATINKSPEESTMPDTNPSPRSILIIKSKRTPGESPLKSMPILKTKKQIYREKWLLVQNPTFFTVQIIGVRKEKSLLDFVESHFLRNQSPMAYFQTEYKGDAWYPLLFGIFSSQKNASQAIKELPEEIQKLSPWIRKVSSVQKSIKK